MGAGSGVEAGATSNGHRASFLDDRNVPKLDGGDSCKTVHTLKTTDVYTLKG